jgi:hypothetical protein
MVGVFRRGANIAHMELDDELPTIVLVVGSEKNQRGHI